jgi:hypothetical protein
VNTNLKRLWATTSSTAVISATAILPAFANGGKYDDGQDAGEPLGMLNAILLFVILPLGIISLITVLTMAPGWASAARKSTKGGFLDDPTLGDRQVESNSAKRELSY